MAHEFQQSDCLCSAKRTGRPGLWARTTSVLANSKTQNAFLFTVNAIFLHDYPLTVEPGSTPRTLVHKKTWRDSLPIDMLLYAVSVLVVAQSSSEIPEGLMNNPVKYKSNIYAVDG
jgi:hypothetical protein